MMLNETRRHPDKGMRAQGSWSRRRQLFPPARVAIVPWAGLCVAPADVAFSRFESKGGERGGLVVMLAEVALCSGAPPSQDYARRSSLLVSPKLQIELRRSYGGAICGIDIVTVT